MESPELHESTAHATGEDAAIVKQPIVTKHLIGIALGIVLAIVVYFLMPDELPEAVAAASPRTPRSTRKRWQSRPPSPS